MKSPVLWRYWPISVPNCRLVPYSNLLLAYGNYTDIFNECVICTSFRSIMSCVSDGSSFILSSLNISSRCYWRWKKGPLSGYSILISLGALVNVWLSIRSIYRYYHKDIVRRLNKYACTYLTALGDDYYITGRVVASHTIWKLNLRV